MNHDDIRKAAEAIRQGNLVVMPTETVYGLGADALNPQAVLKIFEAKERPRFNPLIVHIPGLAHLEKLASHVPEKARVLAEAIWPGPLTLVLPKHASVPDVVTAGLPTVAVRVPRHPIALALLEASGTPIAAPSANLFTTLSPTRVEDIDDKLRSRVECVLDGGPCSIGLESTIIGFIDEKPILLRSGGFSIDAIEKLIGPVLPIPTTETPLAPGMLMKHYAPRTRLVLDEGKEKAPHGAGVGLLTLAGASDELTFGVSLRLSEKESLDEAATNFFRRMRELDSFGLHTIVARFVPERGLGIAINDRLRRAAH